MLDATSIAPEVREQVALVGTDGRLYRETKGLVKARVPVKPTGEPGRLMIEFDRSVLPPLSMLKGLYNELMGKYDHETIVIIGKRFDAEAWQFVVPKQVCTSGDVEMDDDDEAIGKMVEAGFKYIGSVHTHPGNGTQPSGVDVSNWKKPEFGGLHFILGRQGAYTLCAVCDGFTWVVENGELPDESTPADIQTYGKPIEELVTERKAVIRYIGGHNKDDWRQRFKDWFGGRDRDAFEYEGIDHDGNIYDAEAFDRSCEADYRSCQEDEDFYADQFETDLQDDCIEVTKDEGSFVVVCVNGRSYLVSRHSWQDMVRCWGGSTKDLPLSVTWKHYTVAEFVKGGIV